ncbi:hypothetical protein IEC97_22270 [Neobacillus cucumis]|uniref:hypothetical protein n=1 Tax=Neobacillus cucumis TaxID=1740721 RepID=UPI0018E03AC1|nr:hypothetical protein [Neobacillus cucumis]MBI0580087.1 hypothetical protein [Neobacillus cucumis]
MSKKKQKRKARKKEPSAFGSGLKLFGSFIVVLFLGWYMMVDHLDGETFDEGVETPLKGELCERSIWFGSDILSYRNY